MVGSATMAFMEGGTSTSHSIKTGYSNATSRNHEQVVHLHFPLVPVPRLAVCRWHRGRVPLTQKLPSHGPVVQQSSGLILSSPAIFFADQLTVGPRENKIQWCAVGKDEKSKCDRWSVVSNGEVECTVADNTKDCIVKIMVGLFSFSPPQDSFSWREALPLSA